MEMLLVLCALGVAVFIPGAIVAISLWLTRR